MTVDEVVDVVAVRHGFVSTAGAMHMIGGVTRTDVTTGAGIRVGLRNFNFVLVDMFAMRVMQMAVVQVVDVAVMFYGGVTTSRSMGVIVIFVVWFFAGAHVAARNHGPNQFG
jgi:hypothetical protein